MKILLLTLGIMAAFAILVGGIQKIGNYIRGKHPVDYGYAREHINVLLNFSSFKSFYLAAPENFNLGDETVYFREDGYTGSSDSYERTRIGFKTNADLWAYQDWHKIIDEKQQEVAYDEAALEFCHKMSRILEKKKQDELKKAQDAARDSANVLDNLVKDDLYPEIWPGDISENVKKLQRALIVLGYGELEDEYNEGLFGPNTAAGVKVFRLRHHLGQEKTVPSSVIQAILEEAEKMEAIRAKQTTIEELVDATMRPLPPTTDSILGGK